MGDVNGWESENEGRGVGERELGEGGEMGKLPSSVNSSESFESYFLRFGGPLADCGLLGGGAYSVFFAAG